ncbi:MAG: IS110 family transposase [Candidatus Obscuribacterales bacterium]
MKIANVGIDIAKEWFDSCVLIEHSRHVQRFANNASGFARFHAWFSRFDCDQYHLFFEPTGRYGEELVGVTMRVPRVQLFRVDIRKFRRFAQSLDPDLKSDFSDAFALAVFGRERASFCREYQAPSPIQLELRDIQMCLRSLQKRSVTLRNQLKCGLYSSDVKALLLAELERVLAEYNKVVALSHARIEEDPILRNDKTLLLSIPGIGEKTAVMLLSLIDFRKFSSSRSLSKFLGLTPRKWESGTSIKRNGSITKAGNKHVRNALLFPAMSAMQHNPTLKAFRDRLTAAGKPGALVRTAVIRKLVITAWSLIHNGRPFTEEFKPA